MLDGAEVEIAEQRSARSRPLADGEVDALLKQVETVVIARGKAVRKQPAANTSRDELKGPTGGYRAPMLRRGGTLLVGFHADAIHGLLRE